MLHLVASLRQIQSQIWQSRILESCSIISYLYNTVVGIFFSITKCHGCDIAWLPVSEHHAWDIYRDKSEVSVSVNLDRASIWSRRSKQLVTYSTGSIWASTCSPITIWAFNGVRMPIHSLLSAFIENLCNFWNYRGNLLAIKVNVGYCSDCALHKRHHHHTLLLQSDCKSCRAQVSFRPAQICSLSGTKLARSWLSEASLIECFWYINTRLHWAVLSLPARIGLYWKDSELDITRVDQEWTCKSKNSVVDRTKALEAHLIRKTIIFECTSSGLRSISFNLAMPLASTWAFLWSISSLRLISVIARMPAKKLLLKLYRSNLLERDNNCSARVHVTGSVW